MSDTNERSVASTGSVEPVAWLVLDERRERLVVHLWKAPAMRDATNHHGSIVPLFRDEVPGTAADNAATSEETLRDKFASAVLSWISEATEALSHCSTIRIGDMERVQSLQQECAKAYSQMVYGSPTTHDAAPAANANTVDAAAVDAAPVPKPVAAQTLTCDGVRQPFDSASTPGRDPAPPPTLTDAEREAVEYPATWQDECADVEAAFSRSGVRPTWPDDEPGHIGPMAAAMADEIDRLRRWLRAADRGTATAASHRRAAGGTP